MVSHQGTVTLKIEIKQSSLCAQCAMQSNFYSFAL